MQKTYRSCTGLDCTDLNRTPDSPIPLKNFLNKLLEAVESADFQSSTLYHIASDTGQDHA